MKRDNVHSSVIITFQKPIIERDDGQNINSCVATHSEKNACGVIGYALSSEHFHRHTLNPATGTIREAETWKELQKVKWCQVYRTTGQPCSCEMCSGERYSRPDFKRKTRMIFREQLEAE